MANDQPRTSSTSSNFPGFAYLERLTGRYATALTGQAAEVNKLWRSLKDGTWEHKNLGKAWALTVESYYDVMTEALKGPNYSARPEWVYFCQKRSAHPVEPAEAEVCIELQPPDTTLEQTDFVDAHTRKTIPGRESQDGQRPIAYTTCIVTADRKAVLIALDVEMIQGHDNGTYTSLISAKGRSGQPPLVIVTLVVED